MIHNLSPAEQLYNSIYEHNWTHLKNCVKHLRSINCSHLPLFKHLRSNTPRCWDRADQGAGAEVLRPLPGSLQGTARRRASHSGCSIGWIWIWWKLMEDPHLNTNGSKHQIWKMEDVFSKLKYGHWIAITVACGGKFEAFSRVYFKATLLTGQDCGDKKVDQQMQLNPQKRAGRNSRWVDGCWFSKFQVFFMKFLGGQRVFLPFFSHSWKLKWCIQSLQSLQSLQSRHQSRYRGRALLQKIKGVWNSVREPVGKILDLVVEVPTSVQRRYQWI